MARTGITATMLLLVAALAVLATTTTAADRTSEGEKVRVLLHLERVHTEEEIDKEFVTRSTPGSTKYQQHLNKRELRELVRGTPEALAAARRFFAEAAGATNVEVLSTEDVVTAKIEQGSVAAAALGLCVEHFAPREAPRSAEVPARLRGAVRYVVVVPRAIGKQQQRAQKHKAASMMIGAKAGAIQNPWTIAERYNIPMHTDCNSVVQGVGEFQSSYFSKEWINPFADNYNLSYPKVSVSGPNSPSNDVLEGTLDLEYLSSLVPGSTTWWISSNEATAGEVITFSIWIDQVLNLQPMPTVVSISWGLGEAFYENFTSVLETDNDAFRKLGMAGVSVLVASGDSGPGSRGDPSCSRFDASWPASSPYVTSVGATTTPLLKAEERAWFVSGGGFSRYFQRPKWQADAVSRYLRTEGLPPMSLYNPDGRGIPDVSALGDSFTIYGYMGWTIVSGTSCAAPTFAAIISHINNMRDKHGRGPLGFLNPTLYRLGRVGFDVTKGKSYDYSCEFGPITGFPATRGWDAVTGLGTPDAAYLMKHLEFSASESELRGQAKPRLSSNSERKGAQMRVVTKLCKDATCMGACEVKTEPTGTCLKQPNGGSLRAECGDGVVKVDYFLLSEGCQGLSKTIDLPTDKCSEVSGIFVYPQCEHEGETKKE